MFLTCQIEFGQPISVGQPLQDHRQCPDRRERDERPENNPTPPPREATLRFRLVNSATHAGPTSSSSVTGATVAQDAALRRPAEHVIQVESSTRYSANGSNVSGVSAGSAPGSNRPGGSSLDPPHAARVTTAAAVAAMANAPRQSRQPGGASVIRREWSLSSLTNCRLRRTLPQRSARPGCPTQQRHLRCRSRPARLRVDGGLRSHQAR